MAFLASVFSFLTLSGFETEGWKLSDETVSDWIVEHSVSLGVLSSPSSISHSSSNSNPLKNLI